MNGVTFGKSISLGNVAVAERASFGVFDLWWVTLAATLIPVSLIWDFSWESTIGVDRFWSPPHLATHIGVWLSGLLGARLLFVFTLARHRGWPASGVSIGGLCGPSGAWILLWGAAAVQVALLLDNWWQQAYGLGAGLWHPPQILKAIGFFTLLFGGVVLWAGARSSGIAMARTATTLLVWHGGLLLTMCTVVLTMKNYPNWQHTAGFYKISCAIYPAVLLMIGQGSQGRWGATCTALVYSVMVCAMVWVLPLFPARPLTAPIHNSMDHMMPPTFPLLLVVPAVVIDLVRWRGARRANRNRIASRPTPNPSQEGNNPSCAAPLLGGVRGGFMATVGNEILLAAAAGVGFVVTFVPVQWFFARFLLAPAADNWFFAGGGRHWPFFLKIDQARVMFWGVKQYPLTWQAALLALVFAMASAWIGLRVGAWLVKLRR